MTRRVRTVDGRVVDVEQNETLERLGIHAVPLVQYMTKGTEGLQTLREEFEAENKGIAIHSQVRWLANPRIIRESGENRAIARSLEGFVIMRNKVARSLI
jgi:hypothetical protein